MTKDNKVLIEFPCSFPLKIVGVNQLDFYQDIVSILYKYDETFKQDKINQKLSANAKYLSLSVSVYAKNQQHLDDIYRALTAHPKAKFIL